MVKQLFVPTFRVDECLEQIKECLEKGWTGLGYKTVEFEDRWKEYTSHAHAHFLNSATAGIHLAVKILKMDNKWNDDDEIISTPFTFISTNHAIMYEGMHPVFADVDQYLCLDPIDVEKKITSKTKAILFVGIGGSSGQFSKIVDICKKYNLKLITDAAHMAGTKTTDNMIVTHSDIVIYSFQAVKNLPTADSGMICFKSKDHYELCCKLTWLGINKDTFIRTSNDGSYKWKYDVEHVGYKYHGNSIMAAIGLVQLKYLDEDNAYRKQLRDWYESGLQGKIKFIEIPDNCDSSNHLFIIDVDNRDELLLALNKEDIYPGVHYIDNTEYKMYSYGKGTCPNTHKMSERVVSLPMHMRLSKDDVDFICKMVIKYSK